MVGHLSTPERQELVRLLLKWFKKTDRDLPWRKTYDPYHVWISEIMLQQTQMERGIQYFLRWIERFPTVRDVAIASEQEILRYWQGLGYYARARNLHKTAKILEQEYEGMVICNYDTLLTLPGIGPYSAAAIASVAGNHDRVVVDANVIRIVTRIWDISEVATLTRVKRWVTSLVQELLPTGNARFFNQALMDLGGLVCKPKKPKCNGCPILRFCLSYRNGNMLERPVRDKKRRRVKLERCVAIILDGKRIYVQQRNYDDLWGGLWDLPGGELNKKEPKRGLVQTVQLETGLDIEVCFYLTTVSHQYTYYNVTLNCYVCKLLSSANKEVTLGSGQDYNWITLKETEQYGFPSGVRKILEYLKQNGFASEAME